MPRRPTRQRASRGQALEWHWYFVIGAALYLVLAVALPRAVHVNPYGSPVVSAALGLAGPLACAYCWLRGAQSYWQERRRRRLLAKQSSLATVQSLGWEDFERLVGEVFRQWGYRVEETGLGGADGGVDLRLRKRGELTLVQCKHWRAKSVGAPQVREMFGLMVHHQAHAIAVVTSGGFTREARAFADGKPIELIDGKRLSHLIDRIHGRAQ
ncbi:restriction endonuclease (plasmid) [Dyella sp. BiH032]|uniref:restriction endonuclease n=1 Tax=Dyella sp. BiH032 TaxID=3075430 RepID=UPI002892FB9F|nr:restriction endonuclease [Dyella sp. BiH032]WNL48539.1 restriction endonuclease [Dyella sp. BiH032]